MDERSDERKDERMTEKVVVQKKMSLMNASQKA